MATARFVKTGITPTYTAGAREARYGDRPAWERVSPLPVGEEGKVRIFEVWDSRERLRLGARRWWQSAQGGSSED